MLRGVEHFYLINDNSTDGYKEILDKFNNVTLFQNDIETKNVGRQIKIYETYLRPILHETEWLMVLDLDEFLYSPQTTDLKSLISKYNEYAVIRVEWLTFGSNGNTLQPYSVVAGFTKRLDESNKDFFSHKDILKASTILFFDIHNPTVNGKKYHAPTSEFIINHYQIQSLEFYMKVKATRGDCDNWFDDQKLQRDKARFDITDKHANVIDRRLYDQNRKMINELYMLNIDESKNDVTLVITSCNRPELLKRTIESFVKQNSYPIAEILLIDDSGMIGCNETILKDFPELRIVSIYNDTNIGQIESIDKVYSYVRTKYIFHCEEDWEFLQPGFIEKSMKILEAPGNERIFTVWLRPHNCTSGHPINKNVHIDNYYELDRHFSYMAEDKLYIWGGITFNPGLRRTKDMRMLLPYTLNCESNIDKNGKPRVGEYTINKKYKEYGFYAVILDDPSGHVNHIGFGAHIVRPWE